MKRCGRAKSLPAAIGIKNNSGKMNKKRLSTVLIVVFLTGISFPFLCLGDEHENGSGCCVDKSAPVSPEDENCLWHCASKDIVSIKPESFSIENLKTDKPSSLHFKNIDILPHSQHHLVNSARYYLRLETGCLAYRQNHFEAALNRAPPIGRLK